MFVLFTPYSFIFFSLYNILLLSLFTISNFYYYWIVMELIMLLFMGLSYTLFISSYSQLMSYFLIQAISSFTILLSYMYSLHTLFTIALLLNLSIFPFYSWYINVVYRFPNFMLWLSGTLHKLPIILILINFHMLVNLNLMWLSIIVTTLLSGLTILIVVDIRMLLVLSSVGNNSWMLISSITNIAVFMLFFTLYSFSLFIVIHSFSGLSNLSSYTSMVSSNYNLSIWVIALSGIPPTPLFVAKILVILSLISVQDINYFFLLFLVSNSLILIAYLQSVIKYFIYSYSTVSHMILKL